MNLNGILTTCCLVHAGICFLIFICVKLRVLHIPMQMMPLILLIPVAGLIAAIVVEIITLLGQNGSVAVSKDGGRMDAITGATITSRAVCDGVNAALACAATLG